LDSPHDSMNAPNRAAILHPIHGPRPSDSELLLRVISQADPYGVIPLEGLQDEMPSRT